MTEPDADRGNDDEVAGKEADTDAGAPEPQTSVHHWPTRMTHSLGTVTTTVTDVVVFAGADLAEASSIIESVDHGGSTVWPAGMRGAQ